MKNTERNGYPNNVSMGTDPKWWNPWAFSIQTHLDNLLYHPDHLHHPGHLHHHLPDRLHPRGHLHPPRSLYPSRPYPPTICLPLNHLFTITALFRHRETKFPSGLHPRGPGYPQVLNYPLSSPKPLCMVNSNLPLCLLLFQPCDFKTKEDL